MATSKRAIGGVIPAVILCNDEKGRPSKEVLERQLSYLLGGGVDGIFVNGTTGEGAVLSREEKAEVLRLTAGITGGRVPLYGVCLQPGTEAVVEEVKLMADLGAAYVAAVPPYYYPATQDAVRLHFTRIADSSPVPLMLYNIPQNTHAPMSVDTVVELSRHPNIVGIKDSSGNFADFNRVLLSTDPSSFSCVQGEDLLDAASLSVGAPGIVTGLGNVRIEHYVEMYRAASAGESTKTLELQRRIYAIARIIWETGGKVIPAIKAAAELLGRGNRRMKVEGLTLGPEEVERVRALLADAGAL